MVLSEQSFLVFVVQFPLFISCKIICPEQLAINVYAYTRQKMSYTHAYH